MPHRRQVLRLRRTASRLRDLTARRSRAECLPCCECRVGRPEAAKRVEEVVDGKTAIREGRYADHLIRCKSMPYEVICKTSYRSRPGRQPVLAASTRARSVPKTEQVGNLRGVH